MHYLLIDKNPEMVNAWKSVFAGEEAVTCMQGDLCEVSCDAIVSPGNSFGFMDGGIDRAISLHLGWDLQLELQKQIKALPLRELLIGQALTLPTADELIPYLICAPTMRVPMSFNISTSVNAYIPKERFLNKQSRITFHYLRN